MAARQFWIDVGGTFTDGLMLHPDGRLQACKVLSSGIVRGRGTWQADQLVLQDHARGREPTDFFRGYALSMFSEETRDGTSRLSGMVDRHDSATGTLHVDRLPVAASDTFPSGRVCYELASPEDAPLLAMRTLLGLRLDEPLPECWVKLGTTRGTNALLERQGARTALVMTRGFRDLLLIGNQARPHLFDLNITKPEPLFETVIEVDERLDSEGEVLLPLDEGQLRYELTHLRCQGIVSLAVCLLHAWKNGDHEVLVGRLAREAGFEHVSLSHEVSPLIKLVHRGDTTVVDAYLNPILQDYLARLQQSLRGSKLQLMTSAGGLTGADSFRGRDSILSGPAGGVIGSSRMAQLAGFCRSIGFDMGGTSTDVSRFDGKFEREYETTKAGVRIVTPMLAIETVAAGGGSLCHFDGVSLSVGPRSAGASPGPACYGAGGPLTVTDCNLALGRLLPERFPFPLDVGIVDQHLSDLCERIADSPLGRRYAPRELAQGFLNIANTHMARAIRRISVAKGYDPADYVLVTFGGAGGQHACALARELGMHRILIHPLAGLLSALGMGLADVRRFGEVSVLRPCDDQSLQRSWNLCRRLAHQLRKEVMSEGIELSRIEPPHVAYELRYVGQESSLLIDGSTPEGRDPISARLLRQRFEDEHQRLFGTIRTGREIELCVAHIEIVGRLREPEWPRAIPVSRRPTPSLTANVWFHGHEQATGIFDRDELQAGDQLEGPAIVCEANSTIVLEPGFEGMVLERGELLITDKSGATSPNRPPTALQRTAPRGVSVPSEITTPAGDGLSEQVDSDSLAESSLLQADPVRLELFRNHFTSIAEQMGTTLRRTAVSTNVKERLDFSCAIFDAAGRLIVNAPHIPVHLGAMGETVKSILARHPDLAPGDVLVTNDPYQGGSHLPDVTVITPVHDASGQLLFLTASRAHHAEIGGIVPGSMPPFSRKLGEEGVLISDFKWLERGRSREAELHRLLTSGDYPTRNVEDNLSDLLAQVSANRLGADLLLRLIERESLAVVQANMKWMRQAAAEKLRQALKHFPRGAYAFTDHLDDGTPIAVTIHIVGDSARIDFHGSGPVLETNLNANRAIVTAACLYVLRCFLREEIPLNAGLLEPIELIIPDGVLNPPARFPPAESPAMVGGNVETSQRIVDVLLGALQLAAASQGTMNNLSFGDESFGYYETICGGAGATPEGPGADAVQTHMTNTRLTDVEILEHRYPIRVQEFSIRSGSGGNGKHRGGNGVIRRFEFLKPLQVSLLTQRRGPYPPFGMHGGAPGQLGQNTLLRVNGPEINLGGCAQLEVEAGDVLTIETPGGGGWGESYTEG